MACEVSYKNCTILCYEMTATLCYQKKQIELELWVKSEKN